MKALHPGELIASEVGTVQHVDTLMWETGPSASSSLFFIVKTCSLQTAGSGQEKIHVFIK